MKMRRDAFGGLCIFSKFESQNCGVNILSLTLLLREFNDSSGSNVTPRILRFLFVGTGVLSIFGISSVFTSLVHSVKSEDFPGGYQRMYVLLGCSWQTHL